MRPTISRCGFTLIELMVMITLFTALLVVAAPPINNYLTSNRLDTNADRLAADLQLARSLSIANGQILSFQADATSYRIVDLSSGDVLREREFDGGCALDVDVTANFFPWGMAEARVINMANGSGTRTINLLPTGIVEVGE
jgi:type II secretory pathway pseudopilin PulG